MDGERRRRLAVDALAGYPHGPDAALTATPRALAAAAGARVVVLVEGVSDQMALDAVAERQDRDLRAEGIAVVPMGGIHAVGRFIGHVATTTPGARIRGVCDAGEEHVVRRALAVTLGRAAPRDRDELAAMGFSVCDRDLEDELIRAAGAATVLALIETQGDLAAFETLQRQPAWRDRAREAQLHRWLRAGARRNLRYSRLIVRALPLDRMPPPLTAALVAT